MFPGALVNAINYSPAKKPWACVKVIDVVVRADGRFNPALKNRIHVSAYRQLKSIPIQRLHQVEEIPSIASHNLPVSRVDQYPRFR